jgi:hypothetical protein
MSPYLTLELSLTLKLALPPVWILLEILCICAQKKKKSITNCTRNNSAIIYQALNQKQTAAEGHSFTPKYLLANFDLSVWKGFFFSYGDSLLSNYWATVVLRRCLLLF